MKSHPEVGLRPYFFVFTALLALTLVTIMVAFVDLGPFNTTIALSIAAVKGLMVAVYFMHLRTSSHLTIIFAISGFLWLIILLVLIISDYASRPW